MSGFTPFFNKRRDFIKKSVGIIALASIGPFNLMAMKMKNEKKMFRIIKKSEQFNDVIFGGRFHANKPVFNRHPNVQPYSSLFYWSNGYVNDDCEFGLHPHEGFEIMTFLFEGTIEHYDTATRVWVPLNAGDFQIIQSNKGIQHQEKVSKGARAFQIWFDPKYQEAVLLPPSYIDYHSKDFVMVESDGVKTITYVGSGSTAKALTPNLSIRKITIDSVDGRTITLNANMSYTFYVLKGSGTIDGEPVEVDDAIRVSEASEIRLNFAGELFYIELPTELDYRPIWA